MAKKRTKTKAKEPIKIWVKPLKNGNKAIYLRTYQAGSKGRGYTYERLKGLLLVDDKRGSDKEAKAKNEATLRTAMLIRCERIREWSMSHGNYQRETRIRGEHERPEEHEAPGHGYSSSQPTLESSP